jgi:hypothetical protein
LPRGRRTGEWNRLILVWHALRPVLVVPLAMISLITAGRTMVPLPATLCPAVCALLVVWLRGALRPVVVVLVAVPAVLAAGLTVVALPATLAPSMHAHVVVRIRHVAFGALRVVVVVILAVPPVATVRWAMIALPATLPPVARVVVVLGILAVLGAALVGVLAGRVIPFDALVAILAFSAAFPVLAAALLVRRNLAVYTNAVTFAT